MTVTAANLRYEPLSTVTELPRADVQRPTPGAKSGPEMAMSRATWRRAAHTRRENEERADLAALSPLRNVPLAALLSLTCSPQPSAPSVEEVLTVPVDDLQDPYPLCSHDPVTPSTTLTVCVSPVAR
ncbi:unnamed protein product [Arctogadus glacialis]